MNRITASLAFGVFGVITTEFGVIGILPDISAAYGISAGKAGWLISLFALVVAAFGPFITIMCSRFERKKLVQAGLIMFIISNILSASSSSFEILLLARILPAFFLPLFFSNSVELATASVTKEKAIKAVATLYTGLSIAIVTGIPLVTFISGLFLWKGSFLFMAMINCISLLGIGLMVPDSPVKKISGSLFSIQLKVLKKQILWWHILTVILLFTGSFSVYSYMAEYLKRVSGITGQQMGFMLFLFGLTGVCGNWAAGIALSRSIERTIRAYILSMVLIYFVLFHGGQDILMLGVILAIWGFFHMAGFLTGQVWISSSATEAPELANSLVISASNLGIAIGAVLGGGIITAFGIRYVVWGGIAAFGLSLITIWISSKLHPPYTVKEKDSVTAA